MMGCGMIVEGAVHGKEDECSLWAYTAAGKHVRVDSFRYPLQLSRGEGDENQNNPVFNSITVRLVHSAIWPGSL